MAEGKNGDGTAIEIERLSFYTFEEPTLAVLYGWVLRRVSNCLSLESRGVDEITVDKLPTSNSY